MGVVTGTVSTEGSRAPRGVLWGLDGGSQSPVPETAVSTSSSFMKARVALASGVGTVETRRSHSILVGALAGEGLRASLSA